MNKQQFNGIQTKLLTVFILLTLIIVGSFIVFSKQIVQKKFSAVQIETNTYLENMLRQMFKTHIQNVALLISQQITFPVEQVDLNTLALKHPHMIQYIFIQDQNDKIMNTNHEQFPIGTKPIIQNKDRLFEINLPLFKDQIKTATLRIGFSQDKAQFGLAHAQHKINNLLSVASKNILENTLSTSMIAVLLAFLISIITVRGIINPIRSLLVSIRKITAGDLNHTIQIETNDELQQLAEAFQNMTQQLKKTTFSKNYVDSILKSMANLLIVIDPNGKIKSVNQATLNLLQYTEAEILDLSIENLFQSQQKNHISQNRTIPQLREIMNKGVTINQEEVFYKKNHEPTPILFSGTAIRDPNGILTDIVCVAQDITVQKIAEQKLSDLAHYDILTKLPNRLDFDDRLCSFLAHAQRYERKFALLFIDLDNFKDINDTFGHSTGDLLLKKISENLVAILRTEDYIARLGGDEFVVILPEIATSHDAGITAGKIIQHLNRSYRISEKQISLSASIGIAIYPHAAQNANDLAKNADIAMYSAKRSGRNNYQYFTRELDKIHARKLMLENSLRTALKEERFVLSYQPKFNVFTHEIVSIEALLRWDLDDMGAIPPEEFVPLAEKIGLIVPIGKWALETACHQFKIWQETIEFPKHFSIAVNLSPVQLEQPNFANEVLEVLKRYEIPFKTLELELTETALMNKPEQSEKILNTLHDLGIRITIDDFGTGYSSLIYLKKLPISSLKIDKSFTKDMSINSEDATLVKTIIALGKSLKLQIIAEGIETEAQVDFLKQNRCSIAQGFLFSKPVTPNEMLELFKKSPNFKSI